MYVCVWRCAKLFVHPMIGQYLLIMFLRVFYASAGRYANYKRTTSLLSALKWIFTICTHDVQRRRCNLVIFIDALPLPARKNFTRASLHWPLSYYWSVLLYRIHSIFAYFIPFYFPVMNQNLNEHCCKFSHRAFKNHKMSPWCIPYQY